MIIIVRIFAIILSLSAFVPIVIVKIKERKEEKIINVLLTKACYFTVQTNLFVCIVLIYSICHKLFKWKVVEYNIIIRSAVSFYILITFLAFAILLQKRYHQKGLERYTSIINHYVMPIYFLVDTIITVDGTILKPKYIIYWLLYPMIYLIFTLIRGYFTGVFPYYFFDFKANDLKKVSMYLFAMFWGFLLLSIVYYYLISSNIYELIIVNSI